jgi:hypothetical protein
MKEFIGGITNFNGHIQLNLQINGGSEYTRVYENDILAAIKKLEIINTALGKIALETHDDAIFYVDQLMEIFKYTNIEFLYGKNNYQCKYNARVLKFYLRHMIKKFKSRDILELLGLTKILTDLNNDIDIKNLDIHINNAYIDEIIENAEESLIIITREARNNFEELCKIIKLKQPEVQKYYNKLIDSVRNSIK